MALFGRETEREQQRAEAWAAWFRRQHPYAIASLVLGIFSLIEFGALLIFGVAGIVAGAIALTQLRRNTPKTVALASDAARTEQAAVRPVGYADRELPPPIHAADYEPPGGKVEWCEGAKLAWAGIVTSVLSLVIAVLLYLRVFG